jgi:hypothetical protein
MFFNQIKTLTFTTSLTSVLSIETFARFNAPTDFPIHVIKANFARLLSSSPVNILINANDLSLSIKEILKCLFESFIYDSDLCFYH